MSRTITKVDVTPHNMPHQMPAGQFYTVLLYEKEGEFINKVTCEGLETNHMLSSVDVVIHDTEGKQCHLCYVRVINNNTYKTYAGCNPDH